MNGCVYRTKDNECDLWTDEKHKSFCDPDCKDKHPSNADHIRAMTDEELAKFLQEDVFYEPWCPDDVACIIGEGCQLTDKDCGKCALKWLKKEIDT